MDKIIAGVSDIPSIGSPPRLLPTINLESDINHVYLLTLNLPGNLWGFHGALAPALIVRIKHQTRRSILIH